MENPFSYKSANDATGFLLWQVHNLWSREIKKALLPLNLTHTQFVILASSYWLILNGENITQIQIAHHAHADVMMTSNILRTLQKKELITRKEHQIDTRAKVISLTKEGIKILKKAVVAVETFDRHFFNALDDTANFNRDMLQLLENHKL